MTLSLVPITFNVLIFFKCFITLKNRDTLVIFTDLYGLCIYNI